jgi:hypothetical protein
MRTWRMFPRKGTRSMSAGGTAPKTKARAGMQETMSAAAILFVKRDRQHTATQSMPSRMKALDEGSETFDIVWNGRKKASLKRPRAMPGWSWNASGRL